MEATTVPAGYNTVMPYLIIPDAAGFIDFTTKVFEAAEVSRHMRDENKVMHAEVRIGDSVVMLADATEQFPSCPAGLFVYVADVDGTFSKAVNAGATVVMPLTDQPYGRTCGVVDPHGNTWWITTAVNS
ncbi:MAG: VOC family protein [Taibaiella sp.]|nr:VOC family protein [Taibaiella sp.]